MLLLEHIAQLVAYDFRATNLSVDVGVLVPVYPAIDAAAGDEVTQLGCKGDSTPQYTETERHSGVRLEVYCKKCFCRTKTVCRFAPVGRNVGVLSSS